MIELASDNEQLVSRWNSALSNEYDKHHSANINDLMSSLQSNAIDIAILHLNLPELNGVKGVEKIIENFPEVKIFVLTDKPDEHDAIELLQHGILGYANSFISVNYLKEAIRVIKMGEVWIGKRLTQWLVTHCVELPNDYSTKDKYVDFDTLTETERKVTHFIAKAHNNKIIAKELGITERTVKAHLSSIFRKTGANDRMHLMLLLNGNS